MYNTLQKTTKERKDNFFMADFTLNLLNCDKYSETNDFINLMMTHYLLPHQYPTRVTDHSGMIINKLLISPSLTQKVVTSFVKSPITIHNSSLLRKVLLITNCVLLLNVTSHLSMKVNSWLTALFGAIFPFKDKTQFQKS